jgi:CubicO group peptidase (beta-lactamase class C family)
MFKLLKFFSFYITLNSIIFGSAIAIAIDDPLITSQSTECFKDSLRDIDSDINNILQSFNIPGIAVGIVFDNEIVFCRGYGNRDLTKRLPVTENTLFTIASCTKAFTSFILGQLVDEGKIGWDDLVIKYIPEFCLLDRDRSYQVTIRDLLAHRTGISRHDAVWFFSNRSREDILNILPYLEISCGLREEYQYNNLMYSIAGIVIERVTHQTWEEALHTRIFTPLEMNNSNAFLEEMVVNLDFSWPYAEIDGQVEVIPFHDTSCVKPGAGINSNISDMIKWIQLQLSDDDLKGFIQKETLREMHTIHMPFTKATDTPGYGLGWWIEMYRGHRLVKHSGDIDGFASEVSLIPDMKIGIVILTNSSTDGRYGTFCISNMIFDRFFGISNIDWLTLAKLNHLKMKKDLKKLKEENRDRPITFPTRPLCDYVGSYIHPAYGLVQIQSENNRLIACCGNVKIPLNHKCESVFYGEFRLLLNFSTNPFVDFSFFEDSKGEFDQLHIPFEGFRSAKPIVFQKFNFRKHLD